MKSTLFLNNITCLDHGIINDSGHIFGGSYHVSCLVTGEVIGNEAVVIDFSKVKHQIKNIIDDRETGYDHKLLIIPGFSLITNSNLNDYFNSVNISTPTVQLLLPINAIRHFNRIYRLSLEYTFQIELSDYITKELSKLHPEINISVDVEITSTMFIPERSKNMILFNYSHGLKNSSSWGCQNIAHGHHSFITFKTKSRFSDLDHKSIISFLCNKSKPNVFIMKSNIIDDGENSLTISYSTERGLFETTYLKDQYNLITLETETTIEYIVERFYEQYKQLLINSDIRTIYISEGLAKGAAKSI